MLARFILFLAAIVQQTLQTVHVQPRFDLIRQQFLIIFFWLLSLQRPIRSAFVQGALDALTIADCEEIAFFAIQTKSFDQQSVIHGITKKDGLATRALTLQVLEPIKFTTKEGGIQVPPNPLYHSSCVRATD